MLKHIFVFQELIKWHGDSLSEDYFRYIYLLLSGINSISCLAGLFVTFILLFTNLLFLMGQTRKEDTLAAENVTSRPEKYCVSILYPDRDPYVDFETG
jgi:hypothetical protein